MLHVTVTAPVLARPRLATFHSTRIGHPQHDVVARAEPEGDEAAGEDVGAAPELRVADPRLLEDDSGLVGIPVGSVIEQLAE